MPTSPSRSTSLLWIDSSRSCWRRSHSDAEPHPLSVDGDPHRHLRLELRPLAGGPLSIRCASAGATGSLPPALSDSRSQQHLLPLARRLCVRPLAPAAAGRVPDVREGASRPHSLCPPLLSGEVAR